MARKITNDELMAGILSYLSILVLIPLFVIKKKTDFAKFHIQQGMNLFIVEVILGIVWSVVPLLDYLFSLVNLVLGIAALIALIYAIQGKTWKIPVISDLKVFDISRLK